MNTLNIIVIILLVLSFIYGCSRGIVREVASIAGIVLGVIACRMFGDVATDMAMQMMSLDANESTSSYAASIVGNGLLFGAVWLLVYLLARMVRGAIHAIRLGFVDRLCGGIFSAAKWMLVVSFVLNMLLVVAPEADFWGAHPHDPLIKGVLDFAPYLLGIVLPEIGL